MIVLSKGSRGRLQQIASLFIRRAQLHAPKQLSTRRHLGPGAQSPFVTRRATLEQKANTQRCRNNEPTANRFPGCPNAGTAIGQHNGRNDGQRGVPATTTGPRWRGEETRCPNRRANLKICPAFKGKPLQEVRGANPGEGGVRESHLRYSQSLLIDATKTCSKNSTSDQGHIQYETPRYLSSNTLHVIIVPCSQEMIPPKRLCERCITEMGTFLLALFSAGQSKTSSNQPRTVDDLTLSIYIPRERRRSRAFILY